MAANGPGPAGRPPSSAPGALVTSSPMLVINVLTLITLVVVPPPCPPPGRARAGQAKSPGVNSLGSTRTSQLPETSRMTASTP